MVFGFAGFFWAIVPGEKELQVRKFGKSTIILADRISDGRKIVEMAKKTDWTIIQMNMAIWVIEDYKIRSVFLTALLILLRATAITKKTIKAIIPITAVKISIKKVF